MAGVENITKEILQEAQQKADAVIADAQKQAAEIRAEAEADADRRKAEAGQRAEKDAAAYGSRVESQIGLRRRQALLSAKQDVIGEIIEKAYRKLAGQDTDAYFAMIEKLIRQHARSGEGEILFSEGDLKRLPKGYEEVISKAAGEAGGKLHLSKDPAAIDAGFILRYSGIDENCSLRSLFDEKADDLRDAVHRSLSSRAS